MFVPSSRHPPREAEEGWEVSSPVSRLNGKGGGEEARVGGSGGWEGRREGDNVFFILCYGFYLIPVHLATSPFTRHLWLCELLLCTHRGHYELQTSNRHNHRITLIERMLREAQL